VVRRVAGDLFANNEAEIGEVTRRRLFEDIGDERTRKRVAREYGRTALAMAGPAKCKEVRDLRS
jgi:hypothetical protein